MKNGKRPTLKQKKVMQKNALDPEVYFVVKDFADSLEVLNKITQKTIMISK